MEDLDKFSIWNVLCIQVKYLCRKNISPPPSTVGLIYKVLSIQQQTGKIITITLASRRKLMTRLYMCICVCAEWFCISRGSVLTHIIYCTKNTHSRYLVDGEKKDGGSVVGRYRSSICKFVVPPPLISRSRSREAVEPQEKEREQTDRLDGVGCMRWDNFLLILAVPFWYL